MSNAPPVVFQPGMEVVPGYTLIAPLGSGMAGDVWQAQAAGGIKVALKVVRNLKDLGGRKELKALKTIRDVHHPNLCPLFGFWTKDAEGRVLADGETEDLNFDSIGSSGSTPGVGQLAYGSPAPTGDSGRVGEMGGTMAIGNEMPYAPSLPETQNAPPTESLPTKPKVTAEQLIVVMGLGDCTLYDRLKHVRLEAGLGQDAYDTAYGLDAAEAVRYLRSSASAIDLLNQEHQIYHCDIKPQNILLVGGEAQVCDFGLAKQMEGDMRQTQHAFATPAYAPPEVLHNEGYSRQVDQYSLAVTYYELRTGLLPFDITTHASMLVAKSMGKLNLDALTPSERKVLQKALRRVPSERYGSCTEFVNAIAVASGVDKSGGITVGRIIAAVAVLLFVSGLGIGAWRFISPDSFAEAFNRSAVETAKDLAVERANFEVAQERAFSESYGQLTGVMTRSSQIAKVSSGELNQKAEVLFSDAASLLISKIHDALQQAENQNVSSFDTVKLKSLSDCLEELDTQTPDSESLVTAGLQSWSANDYPSLKESSNQYLSLYHAAVVRIAALQNLTVSSEHLEALRQSLDTRSGDFPSGSSIDLSLASLLPVIVTTPISEIDSLSAEQWLEGERLNDLIRASTAVRDFGRNPAYAPRWYQIQNRFTSVISLALKRNGSEVVSIDDQTRRKILQGFPDLQLEAQIAELRLSVEQSRWSDTDRLLPGLEQAIALTDDQSVIVKTVAALSQNRVGETPLKSALDAIKEAGIETDELRVMQTQSLFSSYMQNIGKRAIEVASPTNRLYTQAQYALQIERDLGTPVPVEFLAAATISLLRENAQLITDPQAAGKFELSIWLQRLAGSEKTASLAAAIQLEQRIAAIPINEQSVDPIIQVIQTSQQDYLKLVSPIYADYLFACGSCIKREEIDEMSKRLSAASRQSVESLGPTRLLLATDLLVRNAIAASGISDDDFDTLRYTASQTNELNVSRARSYLSLAEFLMRHTNQSVTEALATELFLRSVATGGKNVASLEIPQWINDRLGRADTANDLSTQVLRSLHAIGVQNIEQLSDLSERNEIAKRLLIRPANTLIERFGVKQFGPRTGESSSKKEILLNITIPTVKFAVLNGLKNGNGNGDRNGDLLPRGFISSADASDPELQHFCQLASLAYTDTIAERDFVDKALYIRQSIALGALASRSSELKLPEQQAFSILAARAAVSLENVGEDQLQTLANQLASAAGGHAAEYLRSEAFERTAEAKKLEGDRISERQNLSQAIQSAENALSKLVAGENTPEILQKQRYDVLTQCADMGVQYAFLNGIQDKLPVLKLAASRSGEAIKIYKPSWQDSVRSPIIAAYITNGNAYEDIAHYCSQEKNPQTIARRNESFDLAIKAFSNAIRKNDQDVKTRFSLARCQYRYAITLDGEEKSKLLDNAIRSLGVTPPQDPTALEDRYQLSVVPEWFHWKLTIELEQNDTSEAIKLAGVAFAFVKDKRVPIDTRNVLSQTCADAYIRGTDWKKAVESLMYLEEHGPTSVVVRRMGLASDIDFAGLLSGGTGAGIQSVFSEHIRILDKTPRTRILTDQDSDAYELAKTATRCVREQVARLRDIQDRRTDTKKAVLALGVRVFAERLDPKNRGNYFALAETLYQGNEAAMNADYVKLFEFACDLAQRIDSIPEQPKYVTEPEYLRKVCGLVVYYSLGYWRAEVEKAGEPQKSTAIGDARKNLTPERLAAIVESVQNTAKEARDQGRTGDEKFALGAIKMLQELVAEKP